MRESVRGFADATIEASGEPSPGGIRVLLKSGPPVTELAQLAADTSSFRDLLGTSAELRSVLTDPGIPVHARRGVVADLFGPRVGADALRLLTYVVGTGRPAELVDDAAAVAERVAAARDGLHPVGPGVLGHHAALERLDGYAAAVLATVGDEGGLSEVEDEMFRFERIVGGSDELTAALTDPDLPSGARISLVTDLLDGKASEASVRLARYATTIGRPREYLDLLRAIVDRVAAESHRRFAEVRSVVELTDEQQRRLAAALSRIVGQPVEVRVVIDPSVLGGFVATIGDTVVDGSVRHRLDLLRERLGASDTTPTNEGAQS